MISQQARSAFDFMAERAIRTTLLGDAAEEASLETLARSDEIKSTHMVILTICGYTMRVMLFLHFSMDRATRAHFAKLKQHEEQVEHIAPDDNAFVDNVMEYGNLTCGALNRELGAVFLHLGMSTPSVLEHGSLRYVEALNAGHIRHWRVTTGSDLTFHASLAVCEDDDVDFSVDQSEVEDTSGELEMF